MRVLYSNEATAMLDEDVVGEAVDPFEAQFMDAMAATRIGGPSSGGVEVASIASVVAAAEREWTLLDAPAKLATTVVRCRD